MLCYSYAVQNKTQDMPPVFHFLLIVFVDELFAVFPRRLEDGWLYRAHFQLTSTINLLQSVPVERSSGCMVYIHCATDIRSN